MSTMIRRRSFMRGLAGAGLAAPLAQLFRMHKGRTATPGALPKVVFFYVPTGLLPDLWHPTEQGKVYNLKQLSAPLEPYKSDLIFMDGVTMFPLSDHQGGSQQLLAGDDKIQTTLDLQLGDMLKDVTPFSTALLGIQCRISKGGTPQVPHPHFTRRMGQEIFPEDNPLAAFDRYFAGFDPGANAKDTASATALLALQQKSILDNATADLNALMSNLPGSEKAKIGSYTDSLRALERRLTNPTTMPGAACTVSNFNPTKFTVPSFSDPNGAAYNTAANKSVVADLQMEIARLALACGRTRVVTLLFEHTNARQPIPGLGAFGVHDASHYTAPPGQLTGMGTPDQVDAKLTAWNNYNVWYAQKFAQFIKMMKETPDVTGSLYDNTIILHASELGDGHAHKTQRIPYVFAGGSALGFKLGQAFNYTGSVPALTSGPHAGMKHMAHSTLLTLVANKMGLPIPGGAKFFGYSGPQAVDPLSIGVV
ncbi:MAG TPA: DUF1552 domain-containing protein [Polyangia bacterium]|nr:DUF1552 domain-containing protein [Polyangia bacterium]